MSSSKQRGISYRKLDIPRSLCAISTQIFLWNEYVEYIIPTL